MIKIYIGNIDPNETIESITALFSNYGKVRSIKMPIDIFSRKHKGFGFIEMEGHEGRAAIAGLNGKLIQTRQLVVKLENPDKRKKSRYH